MTIEFNSVVFLGTICMADANQQLLVRQLHEQHEQKHNTVHTNADTGLYSIATFWLKTG